MATIQGSLSAFQPVIGMSPDARLGLGPDGQVRQTGEQSRLNVFSRAWDFLNRDSDEVQENKEVTRRFVQGIESDYGREVSWLFGKEKLLAGQLEHGHPLTAYRVERSLDRLQEICSLTRAGNRELLERTMDRLLQIGDQPQFNVLSFQERREVTQRAIEQNREFQTERFNPPYYEPILLEIDGEVTRGVDDHFVEKFDEVMTDALARAAHAKLTGAANAIRQAATPQTLEARHEVETALPEGISPEAHLSLGQDGKVRQTGVGSNPLARGWDFLTRSNDQVESNRAVTRHFVVGIEKAYGGKVARMAAKALEGQLRDGVPLSARRMALTLGQAKQMSTQIDAGNRQLIKRAVKTAVDNSFFRSPFSRINDEILNPQERAAAVSRAVAKSLRSGPEAPEQRVEDLSRSGSAALERAAYAKVLPRTSAIVGRDVDGLEPLSRQMDQWSMKLEGLTTAQREQFAGVAEWVRTVADSIVTDQGNWLDSLSKTRAQLAASPVLAMEIEGKAIEYREALLEDMQGLEQMLAKRAGPAGREPPLQALDLKWVEHGLTFKDLDAMQRREPWSQRDVQKSLSRLGNEAFLKNDVEWLRTQGMPVGVTLARFTPDEARLLRQAELGIDVGLQYKDQGVPILPSNLSPDVPSDLLSQQLLCARAMEQGVNAADLLQMREGRPYADTAADVKRALSCVGGNGFQKHDIDWLRANGKPVIETLARFTPEQARQLQYDVRTGGAGDRQSNLPHALGRMDGT